MSELPKVTFNGVTYYWDARLDEFRNVADPHERIPGSSGEGIALMLVMCGHGDKVIVLR